MKLFPRSCKALPGANSFLNFPNSPGILALPIIYNFPNMPNTSMPLYILFPLSEMAFLSSFSLSKYWPNSNITFFAKIFADLFSPKLDLLPS